MNEIDALAEKARVFDRVVRSQIDNAVHTIAQWSERQRTVRHSRRVRT